MLFELLLLASIVSSAFLFLKFKKRLKNLEDIEKDNFLLKVRIKEIEQDFSARENTYKHNLSTLQESFKLERESIQEKKIEIQTKEKDYENTIVKLQTELNLTIIITDHQARDLLAICDKAIILSNSKIVASGTPGDLIRDESANKFYFGNNFQFN